jgi:anthranilate/para-aminobenzoate synthase component II
MVERQHANEAPLTNFQLGRQEIKITFGLEVKRRAHENHGLQTYVTRK